jgi:hypothetical protein
MRKILAGFILAIVIGVPAAYFGLPIWAQQRALRDVDATFEALRASVGKASHGAVTFDVWNRTLKIADISIESDDPSAFTVKAAQFVASGIASPDSGRIAADRVEIIDGELGGLQVGPGGPRTTYRAPKVTVERFSGPVVLTRQPAAIAGAETLLAALNTYAAMTATSVSIPTLSTAVVTSPLRGTNTVPPADSGFTGIIIRNIAQGRVSTATIDHITTVGSVPDVGAYAVEVENAEATDIDVGALIAVLDPAQSKDNNFRSIYRLATTGPYRITFSKTGTFRFASLRLEDIAIRPSKFSDPEILALMETLRGNSGVIPPAEAPAFFEKFAKIYEGVRVAKFEARGFAADVEPNVGGKIGLIRLAGLENGQLAEFAVEGVEARTPSSEPATVGRLAIKNIDLAKIMRSTALFKPGQAPGAEQAFGMLSTFNGIELKDASFEKASKQSVRIDTFALSWGQFVGLIPSQIQAASKFKFTIDPAIADPSIKYLADIGLKLVAVDFNFSTSWNENTQTIAIAPLSAEIADLYSASAKLTINNAPRAIFSVDPITVAQTATQLEAGVLNFSLHDLGGFERIFAKTAKDQQITPDAARKSVIDTIRAVALMTPELQSLGTAAAHLLETPGATINVVVTPIGKANLAQAIETARSNPMALLSQFKIDASTDK